MVNELWEKSCKVCGCTEEMACPGGCHWVKDIKGGDLCSRCNDKIYHDGGK